VARTPVPPSSTARAPVGIPLVFYLVALSRPVCLVMVENPASTAFSGRASDRELAAMGGVEPQHLRRGDAQMWEQLPIVTAGTVSEKIARTRGSRMRK
jgi:hypothetical protein